MFSAFPSVSAVRFLVRPPFAANDILPDSSENYYRDAVRHLCDAQRRPVPHPKLLAEAQAIRQRKQACGGFTFVVAYHHRTVMQRGVRSGKMFGEEFTGYLGIELSCRR